MILMRYKSFCILYFWAFSDDDGQIEALVGYSVPLILYGEGFSNDSQVAFTSATGDLGSDCISDELHVKTPLYDISASADGTMAYIMVPEGALRYIEGEETFYACLKTNGGRLIHQGSQNIATQVRIFKLILPIWFMVCCIAVLLCLSGLFSGKENSAISINKCNKIDIRVALLNALFHDKVDRFSSSNPGNFFVQKNTL